jgi:hypothetical protein
MSATAPPIWLTVRISAARLRASEGKMALKWESKEKNTEAVIEASSITHRTAFLTIRRRLWT